MAMFADEADPKKAADLCEKIMAVISASKDTSLATDAQAVCYAMAWVLTNPVLANTPLLIDRTFANVRVLISQIRETTGRGDKTSPIYSDEPLEHSPGEDCLACKEMDRIVDVMGDVINASPLEDVSKLRAVCTLLGVGLRASPTDMRGTLLLMSLTQVTAAVNRQNDEDTEAEHSTKH